MSALLEDSARRWSWQPLQSLRRSRYAEGGSLIEEEQKQQIIWNRWNLGLHIFASMMMTVIVLFCDQMSKRCVLTQFTAQPQVIHITSFLNIALTWNRGIGLGIFNNDTPYTSHILASLSGIVVIYLLVFLQKTRVLHVFFVINFIIGGAIGNALDRLRHDSVIDFLDVHLCGLHWPAFNVADIAITIGAIVLTLSFIIPTCILRKEKL